MNVGIVGKTGSGKTTVSALVALAVASRGRRVVAVDTDVHPNLGLSLGFGPGPVGARAVPRALARGQAGGGVSAARLVGGYGQVMPGGVTLLHALQASEDVGACGCPGHASARSVLAAALEEAFDVAVLDMEAGLAHVERAEGTLAGVDALVVVMDASRKSVVTGGRMVQRAAAAGIGRVAVVGNQAVEGDAEVFATAAAEHGTSLAGVVPCSAAITDADRAGAGLELSPGPVRDAVGAVVEWILEAR